MSESQQPSPAEAPKQPNIDTAKFDGSTARIYDSADLFDRAQQEGLIVYDRADFGSPIESAQLILNPSITLRGEPSVHIQGTAQLVRSSKDMGAMVAAFKERFVPHNGYETSEGKTLSIADTVFSNCFSIADDETGVKMLVTIDGSGNVIATNRASYNGVGEKNLETEIHSPSVYSVDGKDQLLGAARIYMHILNRVSGVSEHNGTNYLKRTYDIGENVRPLQLKSAGTIKSVGQKGLEGAAQSNQPPAEKLPETPSELEEKLGVDIRSSEILLDDIGGLEQVKSQLRDIAVSFTHPEVMSKWGAERPQGVILYGDPNENRTRIARLRI